MWGRTIGPYLTCRAEFRGPGLANRLQTAIFDTISGICKTRIQQQQTAAAEFGTFLLKTAMTRMEVRIREIEQASVLNLRSHSISTFNRYDRRISLRVCYTGERHAKRGTLS